MNAASVTVRPARMLGWIGLFAFASIMLTMLVDPEGMSFGAALPLLLTTGVTGINETWANYVRVDDHAVTRVHWVGLTYQRIALGDITTIYRQDEKSWYGRERPYVVIESPGTQMHLGINVYYRDGGWPVHGLAEVVIALASRGAPVDEALIADAHALLRR